jgi:ribosomal protein L12E/L44/L45/RPP1/RPP2
LRDALEGATQHLLSRKENLDAAADELRRVVAAVGAAIEDELYDVALLALHTVTLELLVKCLKKDAAA